MWLFFRDVAWGTVVALMYIITAFYKAFGSWWVGPLLQNWSNRHYANEIREAMPFLFEVYGGSVEPSPRKELEPSAERVAYIKADSLLFRFSAWRNETLEALVANFSRPRDMYSLDDLLTVLEPDGGDALAQRDRNLQRYGQRLKGRIELLSAALSEDQIEETRKKLAERRLQRR